MPDDSRIYFRALQAADAAMLLHIYGDQEGMKYRASQALHTMTDALAFIQNQVLQEAGQVTKRIGVALSATDTLIGTGMFRYYKAKARHCEIGYSIGRDYWGQGYGHELIRMQIALLREEGVLQVSAYSHRENVASLRLLQAHGFEQQAVPAEVPAILGYWLNLT